jgi:hypothetical protein
VLTASVTVTQLPRAKPDVILGQIHGADAISSIPFVLLHDNGGAIWVAVKQQQSGPQATSVSLLTNVPLGSPIDFTISDNGDGSLAFTATADGPPPPRPHRYPRRSAAHRSASRQAPTNRPTPPPGAPRPTTAPESPSTPSL